MRSRSPDEPESPRLIRGWRFLVGFVPVLLASAVLSLADRPLRPYPVILAFAVWCGVLSASRPLP